MMLVAPCSNLCAGSRGSGSRGSSQGSKRIRKRKHDQSSTRAAQGLALLTVLAAAACIYFNRTVPTPPKSRIPPPPMPPSLKQAPKHVAPKHVTTDGWTSYPEKGPEAVQGGAAQAVLDAEEKVASLNKELRTAQDTAGASGGAAVDLEALRRVAHDVSVAQEQAHEANSAIAKNPRDEDIEKVVEVAVARHAARQRVHAELGQAATQKLFVRPVPKRKEALLPDAQAGAPQYVPPTLAQGWRAGHPNAARVNRGQPLPLLEEHHRLPDGAWAALRRDGHVMLRELFTTEEITALRAR